MPRLRSPWRQSYDGVLNQPASPAHHAAMPTIILAKMNEFLASDIGVAAPTLALAVVAAPLPMLAAVAHHSQRRRAARATPNSLRQ